MSPQTTDGEIVHDYITKDWAEYSKVLRSDAQSSTF